MFFFDGVLLDEFSLVLREAGAVSINTGLRTATGNVVVGGERDKFLGTMKLKEPRYEAVKMSGINTYIY